MTASIDEKNYRSTQTISSFKVFISNHIDLIRPCVPILAAIVGMIAPYVGNSNLRTVLLISSLLLVLFATYFIYSFERKYRDYLNVFKRIGKATIIVAHRLDDEHRGTSVWDLLAAKEIKVALSKVGKSNFSEENVSSPDSSGQDRDLIIIGGPVTNPYSREINNSLNRINNTINFSYNESQPLGKQYYISCVGTNILNVEFESRKKLPNDFDHAVLYVGPNPFNEHRWLIWIAGLGPYATYGAAKMLTQPDFARIIGNQLDEKGTFCSAIVRYEFDGSTDEEVKKGRIVSFMTTTGRLSLPR